jgi:DNA-binding CsgD family transcriptional regulator
MNAVPLEEHVGKTPFDVIGSASRIIEPQIDHVFLTGEPVYHYEFSAKLPNRTDVGYWIEDYVPITGESGRIDQVCIFVVEITEQRKIEAIIRHLRRTIRSGIAIEDDKNLLALNQEAKPQEALNSHNFPPGILSDSPSAIKGPADILSARELEVLTLLANGKNNKEVASVLKISDKTVETYRCRIKLKLRLDSLVEMDHYAIRHGIIKP